MRPAPYSLNHAKTLRSSILRKNLAPLPLATLEADAAVPVDIYLEHDRSLVLCREGGEALSVEVRRQLLEAGKDALWMPETHRPRYLDYLKRSVHALCTSGPKLIQARSYLESRFSRKPESLEAAYRRAYYAGHLAQDVGIDGGALLDELTRGVLLLGACLEGLEIPQDLKAGDSVGEVLRGYKERFDGCGPLGWNREQQRLPVRIACLVVAFEEATMNQSGEERGCSFDVLRSFIVDRHGEFDPRLVAGFIRILER
ncbi:MAG: hypothetical protein GWP41_00760 [Planctomycetia bacterium]|nr:hypothetical protein [Planctomycetia bacterium]